MSIELSYMLHKRYIFASKTWQEAFKQGVNLIHNFELNQKCSAETNNFGFQFSFIFFILIPAINHITTHSFFCDMGTFN